MRGADERSGSLFSYIDLESRIPEVHPLRAIRVMVNTALADLNAEFEAMYAPIGRPSIPPEKLLRSSLLQAFYTIRSERQLMERLDLDLLFRWFVGLGIDDEVWDHSVFSKNRDRLLEAEIAAKFLAVILTQPEGQTASVQRPFLGRWNAGRSVGEPKEFQAQERQWGVTFGWRRTEHGSRLPGRERDQPNPSLT